MQIINAKIQSTMLGIEDHGCMIASIGLDYGGTAQGFGQSVLDAPLKDSEGKFLGRRGTAYGCEWIRRCMEAVGVEKWEDLPGKYVRIEREDGYQGLAVGIGHIVENKWFRPKDLAVEMGLRD